MTDEVRIDITDQIATVRLNRPQLLNALNPAMALALHRGLAQLSRDAEVRCVVLEGEGDGFMAGGDLSYFKQGLPKLQSGDTDELNSMFDHVHGIVQTLYGMPQVVIAKLHGAVAGFGTSLMLASDLAIAADNARFTLAYSLIGASPDGSSTYALPRVVGRRKAMELALLSERFDAAKALELGIINWVVVANELDQQTAALAGRVARGPIAAYARTKRLINDSLDNGLEQQLAAERESFVQCATGPEFAEGITAFLEKRPAKFS